MSVVRVTEPGLKLGVTGWLADRLGMTTEEMVYTYPYEILAVMQRDKLVGAVLYIHWRGRNIEGHWAGDKGWLSRKAIRDIFSFPFRELGVNRLQTTVSIDNHVSRNVCERLGFVPEGILREAGSEGEDMIAYAMLRSDCHWLHDTQATERRPS